MSKFFTPEEDNQIYNASEMNPFRKALVYLQYVNDKIQYYKAERWAIAGTIAFLYLLRIIIVGGYYALTYCLAIHILNGLIGFISPLEDPDEVEDGESFLPQS